jgi:hypothetical protein
VSGVFASVAGALEIEISDVVPGTECFPSPGEHHDANVTVCVGFAKVLPEGIPRGNVERVEAVGSVEFDFGQRVMLLVGDGGVCHTGVSPTEQINLPASSAVASSDTVGCTDVPVFRRPVRRNPELIYNRPHHTIVAGTLTGRDPVDPVPDEDLQVVETERTML